MLGLTQAEGCWNEPVSGPDGGSPRVVAAAPTGGAVRPPTTVRLLERVSASELMVLILGETGVGKEVLAARIHAASRRAGKPFVKLNCAALAETLLESELFGYERGAFTGAVRRKPGLLEAADGGTVLVDEVGDMPPLVQVKLLRVLEERKVLPVGGVHARPIDVRFLAATNRDLHDDVVQGRFRRDLYFRLNGITLVIPPLRQRTTELAALAQELCASAAARLGARVRRLSVEAVAMLQRHSWPGNIRELRNVIERAVVLCEDDEIQACHLTLGVLEVTGLLERELSAPPIMALRPGGADAEAQPVTRSPAEPVQPAVALRSALATVRRQRILDALAASAGNQTRAAERLGISRRTLVAQVKMLGIPRPRKG